MKLNTSIKTGLITLLVMTMALPAFAGTFRRGARDEADSNYRVAKKAYESAIKDYGTSLTELPDDEKSSICKRIGRALYTNRHNLISEDFFRQKVVKRQIADLEQYESEVGCPPRK